MLHKQHGIYNIITMQYFAIQYNNGKRIQTKPTKESFLKPCMYAMCALHAIRGP